MKKKTILTIIVGLCIAGTAGFLSYNDSEYFLKVYRSIDIFTRVYKEVAVNYVDEVDPDRLMRSGIEGMLKTLDPYTVYISENEKDEIDLVTTGKYGGIGVTIGTRDGVITILSLMEGYSAAKQGIQIGDRILEVDGNSVKGKSLDEVRMMVRGAPGTEVKLKIEREGETIPLEFTLVREEIQVRNVTYSGFAKPGVGYIRLERFSRTSAEDVRRAIKELLSQGELKGLVLDLRGNPGGLLEMAVEVTSLFVPESSLIVSTRGRKEDSERKYYSTTKPILPSVPLAVLVNRNSASASEIVAGAIQDLDRGVIIGTRTFGKGLVQTISQLSNTASLKITTARYYTPSGRCIQEIDYSRRSPDGNVSAMPDSVRHEFHTRHNRSVWDGGGIQPDTTVVDTTRNLFLEELYRQGMFFKFSNHYAATKKPAPEKIVITPEILRNFETFVKEKGFTYKPKEKQLLDELRQTLQTTNFHKAVQRQLTALDSTLQIIQPNPFQQYQTELSSILLAELTARLKGERSRIEVELQDDKQVNVALGLLSNSKRYHALLGKK